MKRTKKIADGYGISLPHRVAQQQALARRLYHARLRHILLLATILATAAVLMLALGAWIQSIWPVFPQH